MFNKIIVNSPNPVDHSHMVIPIELIEDMREEGRFYTTPTGHSYPSVTTVLKKLSKDGLIAWRERVGDKAADKRMNQSSRRGSALHALCEKYLLEGTVDLSKELPMSVKMFRQIQPHIDTRMGNLYGVEIPLFSDILRTAGRSDIMCDWQGIPSIVDFKSADKTKPEKYVQGYFYQCTAYALMAKETYDLDIEQIVLEIGQENNVESQVFTKKVSEYADEVKSFFRKNSWEAVS